MNKKKMIAGTLIFTGMATAMYCYFKRNPAMLEELKCKMLAAGESIEDEMMM